MRIGFTAAGSLKIHSDLLREMTQMIPGSIRRSYQALSRTEPNHPDLQVASHSQRDIVLPSERRRTASIYLLVIHSVIRLLHENLSLGHFTVVASEDIIPLTPHSGGERGCVDILKHGK